MLWKVSVKFMVCSATQIEDNASLKQPMSRRKKVES